MFNRNFLLLWQGQLVSQLGNQAFALAMVYWLMEATGSASLMGFLMMASLLPGVIVGPIGGALADRHSRLGIIIASDLIRGLAVLTLAGVMFRFPHDTALIVWVLFAVALLGGIVNAAFQPAITAAIPDLVPADKIAAGNSLTQFSIQGSVLLGQAVGGILYPAIGAAYLFLVDGITYLFSCFSEAFIRIPQKRSPTQPAKRLLSTYLDDTREGIGYVWHRPGLRLFLLVAAGVNFLAMPVILLLPFYVTDQLGKGASWYGFLLAALGAGSLLGYLFVGAAKVSSRQRPVLVIAALLGTSVLLTVVGFVRIPGLALAMLFAVGACTGIINILVITLAQISTPAEMRGRVIALVIALSGVATPFGMALGGMVGDATGKNIPLLYFACGALMCLLVTGATTRTAFRSFIAWDATGR